MAITLLQNGLDFILDAVDKILNADGESEIERQRLIKYSLLHLSAGIELLFKYRLMQDGPQYIFNRIEEFSEERLRSGDFQSVTSFEAKKRLKKYCNIEVDSTADKHLTKLRNTRNKAEHYKLEESTIAIKELIHKNLSFVVGFILDYCKIGGFKDEEQELLERIQERLAEMEQHHEDVLRLAKQNLQLFGQDICVQKCPDCGEEFLIIDDGAKCLFCNYKVDGERAASDYIENILNISSYEAGKEGWEFPQYECPECGSNSLVWDEDNERVLCFSCGYDDEISGFAFCSECGTLYRIQGEDDIGICPNCIQYKWEKED